MVVHVWRFDAVKIRYFELVNPAALEGDMDVPTAKALLKDLLKMGKVIDMVICLALIFQGFLFVHGAKEKKKYNLRENQKKKIKETLQPIVQKWSFLGEGHHNSLIVVALIFAPLTPFPLVLAFVTISVALNFYWLYCEWLFHRGYQSIATLLPKPIKVISKSRQTS